MKYHRPRNLTQKAYLILKNKMVALKTKQTRITKIIRHKTVVWRWKIKNNHRSQKGGKIAWLHLLHLQDEKPMTMVAFMEALRQKAYIVHTLQTYFDWGHGLTHSKHSSLNEANGTIRLRKSQKTLPRTVSLALARSFLQKVSLNNNCKDQHHALTTASTQVLFRDVQETFRIVKH